LASDEGEEAMTVYVPLLDEGVDVWRPVEANRVGDGLYRLTGRRPDDEEWGFEVGDVVRCRTQVLSGCQVLVAFDKALALPENRLPRRR
jgi:hypothetical protein